MRKTLIPLFILLILAAAVYYFWNSRKQLVSIFNIRYIPVRVNDDLKWSMLDLQTGKLQNVRFWSDRPSHVFESVTRVQDDKGMYRLYQIAKEPVQIGGVYADAGYFFEGLVPVAEAEKGIAYLNHQGETTIYLEKLEGIQVVEAGHFKNGLARFRNSNNKWGYINKTGQVAIPAQFEFAYDFNENRAVVLMFSSDTAAGREKLPAVIDETGKLIVTPRKERVYLTAYSEKLLGFREINGKDTLWGYLDQAGNTAIPASRRISNILSFHDGHAAFRQDDGKWGIMNTRGETVLRPAYEACFYLNGMTMVQQDGEWGFVALNGTRMVEARYAKVFPFFAKYSMAGENMHSFRLIDRKGNYIGNNKFSPALLDMLLATWMNNGPLPTVQSRYIDFASVSNRVYNDIGVDSPLVFAGLNVAESGKKLGIALDDMPGAGRIMRKTSAREPGLFITLELYFDKPLREAPHSPNAALADIKPTRMRLEVITYDQLGERTAGLAKEMAKRLENAGLKIREPGNSGGAILFHGDKARIEYRKDRIEMHVAYSGSITPQMVSRAFEIRAPEPGQTALPED